MEQTDHVRSLQASRDALLAVPLGHVELSHISVRPSSVSGFFAKVLAPPGARAADVTLETSPLKYVRPGEDAALFSLRVISESDTDEQPLVVAHLAQCCVVTAAYAIPESASSISADVRPSIGSSGVDVVITMPSDAPPGAKVYLLSVSVAGQCIPIPSPAPSVMVYAGPRDLEPDQAALLQSWVGPWSRPESWAEVFRASRDGYDAEAFHAHCDEKSRLLVLVREKTNGWLFGGYTAVGWLLKHKLPGAPRYADPNAFLFSLTNPGGLPEKLECVEKDRAMTYQASNLATFGVGAAMAILSGADVKTGSWTSPGSGFQTPTTSGSFPMARGYTSSWYVSELVVFQIPEALATTDASESALG